MSSEEESSPNPATTGAPGVTSSGTTVPDPPRVIGGSLATTDWVVVGSTPPESAVSVEDERVEPCGTFPRRAAWLAANMLAGTDVGAATLREPLDEPDGAPALPDAE